MLRRPGRRRLAILLCCVACGPAIAQEGVTVSGIGEVLATPNVAELDVYTTADVRSVGNEIHIDLGLRGSAELTADAIVKYRDAKRRTLDAMRALKIDDLAFEDLSTWMTAIADQQQRPNTPPTAQMVIAGMVRLKLPNTGQLSEQDLMENVAKILDTAKDSGATIGGNPLQGMQGYYGGGQGFTLPVAAEITSEDAMLRLSDHHERLAKAFADARIKDVDLEERGLALVKGMSSIEAQQRYGGQVPFGSSDGGVVVSRKTVVRLRNLRGKSPGQLMETLTQLVTLAAETGASVGVPPQPGQQYNQQPGMPMARFLVADLAEVREQAYAKAVGDARVRAERLAKLTGLKLGEVVSVQEIEVTGDQGTAYQGWTPYQGYNYNPAPGSSVDPIAPLPVRVRLMVRYAIERRETSATSAAKN